MTSFMKQQGMRFCMAVICASVAVVPALAHHSFVAEYDGSKSVSLTGTVKKLEWTNPHARFYIDVKDASGAPVTWELELGSPNTLIRYAWKRDTMKVGDTVTVEGYLAKDGSKMANAKTVKFADGRTFNAGSSGDLEATK
jgi:uncharacterized protein DUF6152